MDLGQYIKSFPKNRRTDIRKNMAKHVGVAESTIRSWANRTRYPRPKNAKKIVSFTGGKVTRVDLRPDDYDESDVA